MPQAISGVVLALLNQSWIVGTIGAASVVAIANAAPGIVLGLALTAGGSAISSAFATTPSVPKPEDGKYNLKQPVPSLSFVLGRAKKGGDVIFLEEKSGIAYQITVLAAHRIEGFVEHWLHDEKVTLDGAGEVTAPAHFIDENGNPRVRIRTRSGSNAETAYPQVTDIFPSIWTADHRGDGLASVMMLVRSTSAEQFQKIFPQGMPSHTAVIDGMRLYDPRSEATAFSTNLALMRLWHLTHPVGGKLTLDDMYAPDWEHDADVCDQNVTNRDGGTEQRYHGGMWFRADNDPVEVGRLLDEAAQHVIYERADGTIGVHAGEYVAPDIRLTADDISSLTWDANRRRSSSVIAVRGRYTDPTKSYNTVDAAIYGDPYPTDDERTDTVNNQAVQKHNHMARLQKLRYERKNAPRVQIVADYQAARELPYRRYVRVHYPPRLSEAVVEIIGRPTLSLRNLTYTFEGIVVSSALYDFDAETEEGAPGSNVSLVTPDPVPVPVGFDVTIETEIIGSDTVPYGEATFTFQSEDFEYELEWEPSSGGAKQTVRGEAGETTVRTGSLSSGVEYRFRARTWATNVPSDWTSYVIKTTPS